MGFEPKELCKRPKKVTNLDIFVDLLAVSWSHIIIIQRLGISVFVFDEF